MKKSKSFRISETADKLLGGLAKELGITKTAVLEMAIRAVANFLGVKK